jgi:hypothetical protein
MRLIQVLIIGAGLFIGYIIVNGLLNRYSEKGRQIHRLKEEHHMMNLKMDTLYTLYDAWKNCADKYNNQQYSARAYAYFDQWSELLEKKKIIRDSIRLLDPPEKKVILKEPAIMICDTSTLLLTNDTTRLTIDSLYKHYPDPK